MALFALTSTQLKAARWLLRAAEQSIPAGLAYLATQLADNPQAAENLAWLRFHVRGTRATPAGLSEDKAEFKVDVLNITAGDVDTTWTTGDYTTVHNAVYAMGTALLPFISPSFSFTEIVGYTMRFNPAMDPAHPFAPTGPPVWVALNTRAGTGTGVQAYQVAGTVTLKTGWPKHWGRMYLPNVPTNALDTNGRLTSAYRTGVSAAVRACHSTLGDAGFYPVIPVTQLNKVPWHGLLGVDVIQVDDVPDVIRRRRAKQTGARTTA